MKPHRVRVAILGVGLALGVAPTGRAQVGVPPGPAAQPDINNLSHQMAERVRHLGEDIASDQGQTPQGRHLLTDLQELAQTTDEFHDSLHNLRDPFQKRQAYTGIHQTWQHLRDNLAQPGITTPAVLRAAARVDQLDAQIQQGLGLRGYPQAAPAPPPGGAVPPPAGVFVQTQRLSFTLVQRAEFLAASVQAEAASLPDGGRFARQADQLSQACSAFYDSLQQGQDPEVIQQAFLPVAGLAERLETDLHAVRCPPQVEQGLQAFTSTEILIRQQLRLPTPPPTVRVALRPVPNAPSPLVTMSDQLLAHVDVFIRNNAPNERNIPEGRLVLADAQRLQAAAVNFRQGVGNGLAIDPNRLAEEFQNVDVCWRRLARRITRTSGGRIPPHAFKIGEICGQIHNVLSMPGYPPPFPAAAQGHEHDQDHEDQN